MAEVKIEKPEVEKPSIPPGELGLPPLEALQEAGELSRRFNFPDTPRPCFPSMLANGGAVDRHKLLHQVASELIGKHNLPEEQVLAFLLEVNSTMANPEERIGYIHRMVRNMGKKANIYYYACHNELLQQYCIGSDDCPYFKGKYRWKNHPINLENFLKAGWLRVLRSQETNVWFAIYHLYKIKGLGPSQSLFFTFSEVERVGSVGRKYIRGNLERLQAFGLITDLEIQSVGVTASDGYGRHYSLKLPPVLPHPPLKPGKPPPGRSNNINTDTSYGGQKAQPNVVQKPSLAPSEEAPESDDRESYGGQKAQPTEVR